MRLFTIDCDVGGEKSAQRKNVGVGRAGVGVGGLGVLGSGCVR